MWDKVRTLGVMRTLLDFARWSESIMGDCYLNINSCGAVRIDPKLAINRDAHDFDTVSHFAIKRIINLVRPDRNDVVMVLGCGKGRAVAHFARREVRKVIGIEISKEICEIARRNVLSLRGAKSAIDIRNEDAGTADLEEGNIFFMFNPFGKNTLRRVVNEVSSIISDKPLWIIYMNAQFPEVFKAEPSFKIEFDYLRKRGQRVIIYKKI